MRCESSCVNTSRTTKTSVLQLRSPSTNAERITLGDAARLADADRWTMRDILREHGVELRLGLADEDDAAYEVEAASELEFGGEDSDDEESRAK